jgi:hypothetical protein
MPMRKRLKERLSPSMAVSLTALFISLGGAGYAATGGNFILGVPNDATTTTRLTAPVAGNALQVTNTNTDPAAAPLSLVAAPNHAALKVNTVAKVANLNVDRIDDLDSTRFLRNGILQTGAVPTGGVLNVTNTGSANGVQGKTASGSASGVYGENTGGAGFGLAGRAGSDGHAVYGDNTGTGYAGYFEDKVHIGGALDCSGCVSASNIAGRVDDSDKLDGLDSSAFGRTLGQSVTVPPSINASLGDPLGGFLGLFYSCSSDPPNGNGSLILWNQSGSVANVFVDSGGTNPQHTAMTAGQQLTYAASATGDSFHIDAQGAPGVMTIDVATVHRADDCHAQALTVLDPS